MLSPSNDSLLGIDQELLHARFTQGSSLSTASRNETDWPRGEVSRSRIVAPPETQAVSSAVVSSQEGRCGEIRSGGINLLKRLVFFSNSNENFGLLGGLSPDSPPAHFTACKTDAQAVPVGTALFKRGPLQGR